jgi:hypothetical protein
VQREKQHVEARRHARTVVRDLRIYNGFAGYIYRRQYSFVLH